MGCNECYTFLEKAVSSARAPRTSRAPSPSGGEMPSASAFAAQCNWTVGEASEGARASGASLVYVDAKVWMFSIREIGRAHV